jgi:L-cysteine S-thiosulfotransferase
MQRGCRWSAGIVLLVLVASPLAPMAPPGLRAEPLVPYLIDGDSVPEPLDGRSGDPNQGERLVRNRERGNCLICHQVPVAAERFQGDLGPPLAGVGSRLTAGQLRLRLIDQTRINPATIMPAYYRIDGLTRVAPRYAGKPALTPAEIEDVIAWLLTLRE